MYKVILQHIIQPWFKSTILH